MVEEKMRYNIIVLVAGLCCTYTLYSIMKFVNIEVLNYTDTVTQHYLFTAIQSRSITPSTDKYDKILTWGCGNII